MRAHTGGGIGPPESSYSNWDFDGPGDAPAGTSAIGSVRDDTTLPWRGKWMTQDRFSLE